MVEPETTTTYTDILAQRLDAVRKLSLNVILLGALLWMAYTDRQMTQQLMSHQFETSKQFTAFYEEMIELEKEMISINRARLEKK